MVYDNALIAELHIQQCLQEHDHSVQLVEKSAYPHGGNIRTAARRHGKPAIDQLFNV